MKHKPPIYWMWKVWNNYLARPTDQNLIRLIKSVGIVDVSGNLMDRLVEEHSSHIENIKGELDSALNFKVEAALDSFYYKQKVGAIDG